MVFSVLANGGGIISPENVAAALTSLAAVVAAFLALRQLSGAKEVDELDGTYLSAVFGEEKIQANLSASSRSIIVGRKAPSLLVRETQYEILRKYHHQGLSQSRVSFWFSLIFASIGFLIIATAILGVDRDADLTQQSVAVISLLSGTIIDIVASLFFVQSRRAQKVMQDFFDKLRDDRKLEEALMLTDKIADPRLQSRLQILLALNFADVDTPDSVLSALLKSSTASEHNEIEDSARDSPGQEPAIDE